MVASVMMEPEAPTTGVKFSHRVRMCLLLFATALVIGVSAATEGFLFGEPDRRTFRDKVHHAIVYGCLTLLAVSLFVFMFR